MELEVLAPRELAVERRVLEDQADARANRALILANIETGDLRDSRGGSDQRAKDADGRRLAGAVRAQETEDLAGMDVKVDASHGLDLAVGLDEVTNADHRLAHGWDSVPTPAGRHSSGCDEA